MQTSEVITKLQDLAARRKLGHFSRWSGVNYHTLSGIARQRGHGKDTRGIKPETMAKIERGFERLEKHGEEFAFQSKRDLPTALAIELEEWPKLWDYICLDSTGTCALGYSTSDKFPIGYYSTQHTVLKSWRGNLPAFDSFDLTSPRVYRQQWEEVRKALGFN